MKLPYSELVTPFPIPTSFGTLLKPTLREIAEKITIDRFVYYESLMQLTPKIYYEKLPYTDKDYWNSLSELEQLEMTLYDIILADDRMRDEFVEILNFFIKEPVVFVNDKFVVIVDGVEHVETVEDIRGVITADNFSQVIGCIMQTCFIDVEDKEEEKKQIESIKFKTKSAKALYLKLLNAKKEEKRRKTSSPNMSLANIISGVSNFHPTISPLNVYDLTVFQLYDSFSRLKSNAVFKILTTQVSVWGSDGKKFDDELWHSNYYDASQLSDYNI